VTYLLDVNVLIALIDPAHVGHDAAQHWFEERGRYAAAVAAIVARLRTLPGHTSGQVTDSHLLALAVAHGGFLATFDHRLSTKAVKGGKGALHFIGSR